VGDRLDSLLFELGRSVRRLVRGDSAGVAPSDPRPARLDPGRLPGASQPRRIDDIEPTRDGRFRAAGYIFTSERQARQFLERSEVPKASQGPSPPPSPPSSPRQALRPSENSHAAPSASERELMSAYGISSSDDGGFAVRGFVFKTLDQAVSWARRSGRSAPTEPRLPIGADDRFRWPVRERPPAPPPPPPPASSPSRWSSPPPPAPRVTGKPRWIGPPTQMEIGGVSFVAEMVYVGKSDRYEYPRNNSLVDPTLPVGRYGDPEGSTLSYWGCYQDLHQSARRTYLEWLAGGRSDPSTPIGYVFIFFYGLEWRLLHEGKRDEAAVLVAEVRRLLGIYGNNHSFRGYAERFLDVGVLLAEGTAEPIEPTLVLARHWEMPLRVRVYLGSLIGDGQPLEADAALVWVLSTPGASLRTAATRCFAELRELWAIRFGETYPQGLAVRQPKARIKHAYRAASGAFTKDVSIDQLPDITTISAPLGRLRALLEACTDELDPLSRLLGRQPEARGNIAAAAVAPQALLDGPLGEGLRACSRAIADRVGGRIAAIPVREVLELLEIDCSKPEGRVSAATLRQMAALLDSVGFGFEPDRRYGCSLAVAGTSKLLLFSAAGGGRVDPERPSYDAARTMIEIAALAALADGLAVPVELQSICRDLASLDPPKRKEAIARMVALPLQERRRVTQCAIAAILADGHVLPAEVRFLEHLHTALGLPQEDVYSALHRGSVEEDQPVRVAGAEVAPGGRAGSAAGEAVRIDAARLERIRGETSAVSALLAGIFVEEEEEKPTAPEANVTVAVRFDGLDTAHAELLWVLVQGPLAWDEFEEQARGAKLLPAGAIETINEWGFEMLGEPVIEEEDPVAVAAHLAQQLAAMGAGA
jgi:hypothetical protein